jgi:hypothetical protein
LCCVVKCVHCNPTNPVDNPIPVYSHLTRDNINERSARGLFSRNIPEFAWKGQGKVLRPSVKLHDFRDSNPGSPGRKPRGLTYRLKFHCSSSVRSKFIRVFLKLIFPGFLLGGLSSELQGVTTQTTALFIVTAMRI